MSLTRRPARPSGRSAAATTATTPGTARAAVASTPVISARGTGQRTRTASSVPAGTGRSALYLVAPVALSRASGRATPTLRATSTTCATSVASVTQSLSSLRHRGVQLA